MVYYWVHWLIYIRENGKIMLYTQDVSLVEEARKTGKGNSVWIEILKFLAVSISAK